MPGPWQREHRTRPVHESAASPHARVDPAVLVGLALALPCVRGLVPEVQARLRAGAITWTDLPDLVERFRGSAREPLLLDRLRARATRALATARQCGMHLLECSQDAYPRLLLHLPDPPVVLWVSGAPDVLSRPAVAIVGARAASRAALETARRISRDLAAAGLTVVSGLARGVDAAAHEGALEAGHTVAVLGCGADVCYPPEHQALASRIAARGALMTEFAPGTPPRAGHFPRRNRLVAGLALATVVVEAGPVSGALITAREALDQGKEVLVVPGLVLSGRNRGGHALIKDGAGLVEDADDIVDALRAGPWWADLQGRPFHPPDRLSLAGRPEGARLTTRAQPTSPPGHRASDPGLPEKWATGEELDLDDLLDLTGVDTAGLLPRLLEWELEGAVARTPGGRFVRLSR
jgi:DNA processing protein